MQAGGTCKHVHSILGFLVLVCMCVCVCVCVEFLSAHAPNQAASVQEEEPSCLTYQFYIATDSPDADPSASTRLVVYERYVSKDCLTAHAHDGREKRFHQGFIADEGARPLATPELRHYTEQNFGFIGQE